MSVHTGGVTLTESSSLHRQCTGQSMNLHIEVKLCSASFQLAKMFINKISVFFLF